MINNNNNNNNIKFDLTTNWHIKLSDISLNINLQEFNDWELLILFGILFHNFGPETFNNFNP